MTIGMQVLATFKARDIIVEQIGEAVPGIDLVEILADAMVGELDTDMTCAGVANLVVTVARQRIEAYNQLRDN